MTHPGRARAILLELTKTATSVQELPRLLVRSCARALPISGVGLTLMTEQDHPAGLVAATDGVATVVEELQFTLGEGPCIDASRSGRPVLVPHLLPAVSPGSSSGGGSSGGFQGRWPVFAAAASAAGVAAIFAFPLRVGAIRVGVLNLYRDQTGELDWADVAEALAYADAAVTVLLHLYVQPHTSPARPVTTHSPRGADETDAAGGLAAVAATGNPDGPGRGLPDVDNAAVDGASSRLTDHHGHGHGDGAGGRDEGRDGGEVPWWAVPMSEDRAVVHQATGMISVTAAVTLAQALVLLRARAYSEDRPVHEIAADVVTGTVHISDPRRTEDFSSSSSSSTSGSTSVPGSAPEPQLDPPPDSLPAPDTTPAHGPCHLPHHEPSPESPLDPPPEPPLDPAGEEEGAP